MKKMRLFTRVCLSVCLILFTAINTWAAKEIKIGVIGPMNFTQGQGQWNGALMAADEINANGGIQAGNKKMKIKLIKADSNEFISITDAASAMERVIAYDKADFIVGGFRTEAVLAMQDIASDYKKIFLGCGAASKILCDRVEKDYDTYKYWFRVTPQNNIYLVKTNFAFLHMVATTIRKELGIAKPKVAIVGEKQVWVERIIGAAKANLPKMGMEVVGAWRPSQTATDMVAELAAIQKSGAHIIFTLLTASSGITFAKQAGELKIPAVMVGINIEASKETFWETTKGNGNYVMTISSHARNVEYNELTKPYLNRYIKRFGEIPTYTAGTYNAVKILKQSIENAGTLDSDKVIPEIERYDEIGPGGRISFNKSHDVKWGPGFITSLGVQWQDGKLLGVWPNQWRASKEAPPLTYKGIAPFKLPPWMIEKYKK
ncbi:MAG: ABC transporter substrate-binding protein [Deltaproteobacteria bacterium]|nr:ABC transporter substrate-binding protein [Deltaproteobacteria bacterium]